MRGLPSSLVLNFLTTGLGVVSSIVLARYLGPEGRGTATQLMYWPQFVYAIAHLSIGEALILASSDPSKREKLHNLSLKAAIVTGSVSAAGTALWIAIQSPDLLAPATLVAMLYAAIYLPCMIFFGYRTSLLQIDDRHATANLIRAALGGAYALLLIALALTHNLSPTTAVAASAISIVAATAGITKITKAKQFTDQKDKLTDLIRTAIPLHTTTALNGVNTQIDRLSTLFFLSSTEIGIYIAGWTIASASSGVIAQAIHTLVFPRITSINSKHEQLKVAAKSIAYTSLLCTLFASALYFFIPKITVIAFGPEFIDAIHIANTLTIAWIIVAIRQVSSRTAKALGLNNHNIGIELLFTTMFVTLCFWQAKGGETPQIPEIFLACNAVTAFLQLSILAVQAVRLQIALKK